MKEDSPMSESDDSIKYPVDGTLDLHMFAPCDTKELIPAYLAECLKKNIFQVRIVHGKGTGALRETVHSLLRKLDIVDSFNLAGESGGGWGATIVSLRVIED
jgi:dsDNA-specific endonuclease/ATPase MutS2